MQFDFDVYGEKLISRDLLRLEGRIVDARPAFEVITDYFRHTESDLFASEGASGGAPWQPLAPSTIRSKQAAGQDNGILQATEALRRSLTEQNDPNQISVITDSFMMFGTSLDRGEYHQRGRGVPVRRPLQFDEQQKRTTVRILQAHVLGGDRALSSIAQLAGAIS